MLMAQEPTGVRTKIGTTIFCGVALIGLGQALNYDGKQ